MNPQIMEFLWDSPTREQVFKHGKNTDVYFRAVISRGFDMWVSISAGPYLPLYPLVSGAVFRRTLGVGVGVAFFSLFAVVFNCVGTTLGALV